MRKPKLSRKLLTIIWVSVVVLAVCSKKTTLLVKAAQEPIVTKLEIAASADGAGIVAKCSYQNYTAQSGYEIRLYLYKLENDMEFVESQKALTYAEQGSDSTQPMQVEEGVYRASVTIDDGIEIIQINSLNYYRVSRNEESYVVVEENGKREQEQQIQNEEPNQGNCFCIHECEYILIEQATPIKDAIQAYQCIKCGSVFDYVDVPNSAYAAFLKEAVSLIQNTQQKEVTITTDRWISFNRDVFEMMKIRSDVSVQVNYWNNGEEKLLVIPAGVGIDCFMDENGYGGFKYIEEILRQTEY